MTDAVQAVEAAWHHRRQRRMAAASGAIIVLAVCVVISALMSEVSPARLADGLPRAWSYLSRLIPDLRPHVVFADTDTKGSFAYWMYRWDSWLWLLFETSQMAALATLLGGIVGGLLCFPAAANLSPSRPIYFLCRRTLELLRCVPDIVYALILVWTFGVGPLAGILAIALHTAGALGKLFAEAVENADMRPWEALTATGANWMQSVRFAIVPQVLPNFLSYLLLRFEINVRGATVIGFVGAGGIGQELYAVISSNYYQEIGAIVVLIVLAVFIIDLASEQLRTRAIGNAAHD